MQLADNVFVTSFKGGIKPMSEKYFKSEENQVKHALTFSSNSITEMAFAGLGKLLAPLSGN